MKILDKYILKRYLGSFIFTLLILIPIAIAIDISQKVDKFLRWPELTTMQIIEEYYLNFTIYYANTFMPLALFISIIFFTSKLAANTEIIAINSAKISFTRMLRPYMIGATIVTIFALSMNHYIVPKSRKVFEEFNDKYMRSKKKRAGADYVRNGTLQLSDGDYVFIKNFNLKNNRGQSFTFEHFDGHKLKYKIFADAIRWNTKDSTYELTNYRKRTLLAKKDLIEVKKKFDTVFDFKPSDLLVMDYISMEKSTPDLVDFIDKSKARGVKNLNTHLVELYKRTSLPLSSYILTIIAVALSSRKKRGGTGVNLAIGISLMFTYVFFIRIAEVLGSVSGANSLLYVWFPNIVFGAVAIYLYINAKK
ncbi:LptF/LptG family permease [Aureivirga sp. CE67]|uniref:LptF/LptG family permease n=1 Tax=Aureivirga sp. CE67 TaxID=1788983 RepID=UPI0018CA05C1|nr:LptF/LptG family permease [Aureivirga sp. CE67]